MTMRRIKTISELQESGFGQPWPRLGLKLLYWFANQCISDACNDDMVLLCDPTRGDFGFHFFDNRCDGHNMALLPTVKTPYFIVGNQNSRGAHMLPRNIKRFNFGQFNPKCNADRIIVNVQKKNRFGKVYVTTQKDQSSYDPCSTFHITRTLIGLIKSYDDMYNFMIDIEYYTPFQAVMANNLFHQLVLTIPSEDDCDAESQISSRSENSTNYIEKKTLTCMCTCIIL